MISVVTIGFLVGIIAKCFVPSKDPGGILFTIALAIGGSICAHWIGTTQGWFLTNQPIGILSSLFGSILLISAYRVLSSKGARRR